MQSFGENNFMPLDYGYERSLFVFCFLSIHNYRIVLSKSYRLPRHFVIYFLFTVLALMQCSALMVWIQKKFFFSYRDHKIP